MGSLQPEWFRSDVEFMSSFENLSINVRAFGTKKDIVSISTKNFLTGWPLVFDIGARTDLPVDDGEMRKFFPVGPGPGPDRAGQSPYEAGRDLD